MKKVALVTGGSRGIGYGIVKQLAIQGFDIALNGVRPEESVVSELKTLRATGAEVLYCQGDISSRPDREKILLRIRNHFGRLNVLVNNAGIAPKERSDILSASEESFDEVISVNLKGTYFLTQEAANWLIRQKNADKEFSACIINVTSISSAVASVNRGDYCISKAALSMATQLFAIRLGEFDIPVYEIRPGIIRTDMTEGVKDKYDRLIEDGLCVQKRWGLPGDVAKVVGALVSDSFSYSTGQVIMVDGGMTLPRL